jgi:hypothetical protein
MGCGCGGRGAAPVATGHSVAPQQQKERVITQCTLSKDVITKYKEILLCLKINNSFSNYGLNIATMNSLIGVMISALNYPTDYCYYQNQINNFQQNYLPRIIESNDSCM